MSYGKLWPYLASVVRRAKDEEGQALAEYTLVLVFVAMTAVLALGAVGVAIAGFWGPLLDIME